MFSRSGMWNVMSPCLPAVLVSAEVGMQHSSSSTSHCCFPLSALVCPQFRVTGTFQVRHVQLEMFLWGTGAEPFSWTELYQKQQPVCNSTLPSQIMILIVLCLSFPVGTGSPGTCRQLRGFCFRNDCPHGTTAVGVCGRRLLCCKR